MTYKADDKIVGIEYVESGKTPANVPDAPAKEGRKFIGWQKDGTGDIYTKDALEKIKISENTTYVAKYEEIAKEEYAVSFVVDGKVVKTAKVTKGNTLTEVPEDPKVDGYKFKGWQKDGAGKVYDKDTLKDLAIKGDTVFVASLEKEVKDEDIVVPDEPSDPKPSEEYARITFAKGEHGSLEGKTRNDVSQDDALRT